MTHLNGIPESLTKREIDILRGIAEGLTNPAIAERFTISVATVRWYTKQIYRKLEVNNRTQAGLRAHEIGITGDDTSHPNSALPSNLPQYLSSFVGRHQELTELSEMLVDPSIRLVTIVGPGGMGKTRLAVEVVQEVKQFFADGVYFIPLDATITTDDRFRQTFHRNLNILTPSDPFAELQSKEILVIFDNFEQSLDQRGIIVDMLAAIPQAKVLITSQVSLNLRQEWIYRLPSLFDIATDNVNDLPDAIKLFADRVKRVNSAFQINDNYDCVAEICKLVQGMPLAIEIAASWLKTVSCHDVLHQLHQNIDFLSTTSPDIESRHQSLKAVFEHTWNLLSEEERRIFKRLSVFRGEFGFSAAQQIAGASLPTVASLVDWSLIRQTSNNLYQSHELLRHYAEQKLRVGQHGKHSNIAFAVVSLLNGDFNRVEEMANKFLEDSSDELNLDKGFAMAILAVIAGVHEEYEKCLQLGESSIVLTAESPIPALFSYLGLSIGYCGMGDYAGAWTAIKHALEMAQSLQSTAFITLGLPVVALINAFNDKIEESAMLISLIMHHPVHLPDWMLNWTLFKNLHESITEENLMENFQEIWEYGQALDPQIVAKQILEEDSFNLL